MRNVPETVHAYNISRLNWIFVFFSAILVACMVWMIWFDYIGYRGWKDYQKEFQQYEAAKLRREMREAERKAAEAGLEDLQRQIVEQENLIEQQKENLKQAEANVAKLRIEHEIVDTQFRFRKADLDAQKYNHDVAFEEFREHPDDEAAESHYRTEKAKLDAMMAEVANLELKVQQLEKKVKEAEQEIAKVTAEQERLNKEKRQLLTRRDLARKRYEKLTDPLIQKVLNAPFLEIAQPTIRVKQIVVEDHLINVNFAKVPRVDRCISCHGGIDKKDPTDEDGRVERKGPPTEEQLQTGDFLYADLPQPHTAHPRLDLFVSDTSPHPMAKFGCTSCHWGWDRAMDFSRAAHMPDPEKTVKVMHNENGHTETKEIPQEEYWKEKYHWHEMHHAEQKMRPVSFLESSCLKCHEGQTRIREAGQLNRGIRLIEQAGCYNCHKMRQLETFVSYKVREGEDLATVARQFSSDAASIREANNLKTDEVKPGTELSVPVRTLTKTGPSLYKIGSKLDKNWVRRWLAEPKRFRPNTFMPQFWGLENTYVRLTNLTERIKYTGVTGSMFDMADREVVEIEAITETLFAISDEVTYPKPPVVGDPGRGKTLVENLGCFACHVVNERLEKDAKYADGTSVDDAKFPLLKYDRESYPHLTPEEYARSRSQGPMLFGTGSKTSEAWLFAWLKNPKSYHPRTKMPNLRLEDQEAADIAAYLSGLRHEEFEKMPLPDVGQELYRRVRDDMVQEYLESEYSKYEAKAMAQNYNTDANAKLEFDSKLADFLRRIKYSRVNRLMNRWSDLVSLMEKYSEEITMDDRKSGKNRLERLSADMRDLAAQQPQLKETLSRWADQVTNAVPLVVEWNYKEREEQTNGVVAVRNTQQSAADEFRSMTLAESQKLDWEEKKKLYLGEKLIGRYGCYSCHDIRGFETAKPIGTELSEWGSKLTDKLDFGYLEGMIDHSNYAYVQQKIKAPRSFDKLDVKRPQEWFKMPQYNFNAEQRKAIATVIMGMTDEKVLPQARKQLSEAEWQMENGRWLVKELNCVGCHVVERHGGAILATIDPSQKQMFPPNLEGTGTKLKPNWLYHFLKEPGENKYRYWLNVRMPTFGFSDEQINSLTRYFALLDGEAYPFEEGVLTTEYDPPRVMVQAGEQIYEKFQCLKCHQVRPAEMAAKGSNIGPPMIMVKERMRPKGLVEWLKNPGAITPGVNMPANWPTTPDDMNPLPNVFGGSTEKQIQAVADYLLVYDGEIEKKHPLPTEQPAASAETSEYE